MTRSIFSMHGSRLTVRVLQYLGTFARVWLARLKDQKDKNQVYALKILRKADGKRHIV